MIKTQEDFLVFSEEVKSENRTFLSDESKSFLDWVRHISESIVYPLDKGEVLYRARVCDAPNESISKEGMKPVKNLGSEGRANSFNINMLYLARHIDTAIAEVRPSQKEHVTVAHFKVNRDLRILDLTAAKPCLAPDLFNQESEVGVGKEDNLRLLRSIGLAFSKPLSNRDHRREYLPTQTIAEYIKSLKYDGICYQSQFFLDSDDEDTTGLNFTLFDLDAAEPFSYNICEIEKQIVTTKILTDNYKY